jgi:DNA (cytosine-5)-methyltransferase 1
MFFTYITINLKKIFFMEFRLGELFCGPGGIAVGAREASFIYHGELYSIKHEWANDYDKDTCETYALNICPNNKQSVICKDVRELDIENLTKIDALAFGFPCNDFSIVGEQKGITGTFGPLYSYGVKVLKKFQPKWFLAENVGGLRNSNDGYTFQRIISELIACGYDVVANLYKFENYEIPQARHRIIIVGIRNDLGLTFKVPIIKNAKTVTSLEAIESPPIPKNAPNNELTKQSSIVEERLKHIKPGQNAFNAELPFHLRLNIKGAQISQIYKRLDPNKPAYTVTGSGGGGTHIYHWKENRALTNRERARLQTFPDDFIFCGTKESVRKQIGMAVPPKGIKIIFEAILKTFAGIPYDNVVANINTKNKDLFGKMVLEPKEDYIKIQ